jgi:molecular chaperone IbpA
MTYCLNLPEALRTFTVGFEDAYRRLDEVAKQTQKTMGYPPYNIVKVDDNKYVIELAVAGFSKQDLEIELKENSMIISGKVSQDTNSPDYLYKGIADRAFVRQFKLADTIEIQNTHLINGMLKIYLENIIPESKKPRKLEIGE